MRFYTSIALLTASLQAVSAQSANCTLRPSYAAPVVADGWQAQLVHTGLKAPRSILFDSEGGLLVLDKGSGVRHLKLTDGGGSCVSVESDTLLLGNADLNHGLALSNDGTIIYASSADSVFAWSYNASGPSTSGTRRTVVSGMDSSGHTSRTLLMSQKQPGILVVSRGSDANLDLETADVTSGRSQIKAFDLNTLDEGADPYDYSTQGRLLGWGLRNSVGVGEEPLEGGVYSVENSADQIERNGQDIHQNNPGEEMNYHGFLNGSTEDQGGNYGYPYCFAAWSTDIPDAGDLKVGEQFSFEQNATVNDTFCREDRVAPRLTFQAHMAPLDIIFLSNGTKAFVTFHGSWDRTDPVGYKVSSIDFANGSPVAPDDSTTSTTDIMSNPDNSKCPGGCFRPVSLALDSQDRMFMSSDSTGEIWVLVKAGTGSAGGSAGGSATPSASGSPTASGSAAPSGSRNAAGRFEPSSGRFSALFIGFLALLF